jgi:hypothetical protein
MVHGFATVFLYPTILLIVLGFSTLPLRIILYGTLSLVNAHRLHVIAIVCSNTLQPLTIVLHFEDFRNIWAQPLPFQLYSLTPEVGHIGPTPRPYDLASQGDWVGTQNSRSLRCGLPTIC